MKRRQPISYGGAHTELSPRLPLPGPRRTQTAALHRTFHLTLRREKCSYKRCRRSACCSGATTAAKAGSEAQPQLFPVRQREISETPSGSAGLGSTAQNSGAERARVHGELCLYCCSSSSLISSYGRTARVRKAPTAQLETQRPQKAKKKPTTNPNKPNKSTAGFPPDGKSPCSGFEEPLAAAARHGARRGSVGGTAQL